MSGFQTEILYFRYCFMKIEDICYVVAVDLVSQISKELGVTCDVIDTFDPTNFGDIICSHPMDPERRVCLYPADHATTDIGTGIVHTAPPHGVEDFQIANQHNLPSVRLNYDSYLFLVCYHLVAHLTKYCQAGS